MENQEKDNSAKGGGPTATGSVDTSYLGPIDEEESGQEARAGGAAGRERRKNLDTSGGTERAAFGEKTTGG